MSGPADILDLYAKLYTESFISHPFLSDNEYHLLLKESDPAVKIKEIILYNVPKNTLLLPLHEYSDLALGNKMKNVLRSSLGLFKCCDYSKNTKNTQSIHRLKIFWKNQSAGMTPSRVSLLISCYKKFACIRITYNQCLKRGSIE